VRLGPQACQPAHPVTRGEDETRTAVCQRMGQGLVRELGVQRDGRGSRSHGRQRGSDPLRPVRGDQSHGVAGLEPAGRQSLGELPHGPGQLPIGPLSAPLAREGDQSRPLAERGEAVDQIVESRQGWHDRVPVSVSLR
jgi:hypothetical protein